MAENTTSSAEVEDEDFVASDGLLIFAGFVIIFMILQAIIGNTLTILSYIRDKHLRTTYNLYLINLAIADLTIAAVSMTVYLTYTLRKNTWVYGYHVCKVYLVLDFLACTVTVILMNVISYDRLMLLKQGAAYYVEQNVKKAIFKMCASWMIGFLLYGPAIIGWDHWTGEDVVEPDDCDVQFVNNTAYTTTTAVVEFFLPLTSLGVLNILVIIEIRKLRHNKVHTMQISTVQSHGSETVQNESFNKKEKAKQKSTKKATKAARSLAILVFAFFLTWAPYTILTVVISFCDGCVIIPVYEAFTWFLWFKSALNPFLYAFSSARFRENFLYFLCCGKRQLRQVK
ncbi:HRH3 [Mytilus coruscus]|uniref:HRH3 n=1 Tax=Mytilus coruscus TaxID=42192 RepID=A0A6J8DIV3_MYTCO|nr:HRH3 [Mytilus coruscus]